ncbi:MAG: hypothetical protein VKO21_11965, partial [Candidatus Sericytochromatia bacterium]|nr:hypothetical protein [Candidatus Sericytochromatia bacterium]
MPRAWPRRLPHHLSRDRLSLALAPLRDGGWGEVTAGAGGGKTSLAVDWAESQERPVVWLPLGSWQRDPHALASACCAAVRRIRPGADTAAQEWLARPGGAERHAEEAMRALADGSGVETSWSWIVDGVEVLEGAPAATTLLDRLLVSLPHGHQILLLGRRPFGGFAWRKARLEGRLIELGPQELRLLPDEVRALARLRGCEPSAEDVEDLMRRTSGWPLGVSLLIRNAGTWCGQDLEGYLTDEVLAGLSPGNLALLETLSPLERVPPSVVLGLEEDAVSRMQELVREGLLLPPWDGEGWVLPGALRDVLRRRLEERGDWHIRARELLSVLRTAGLDEAAYRLARESGEDDLAVELLGRLGPGWIEEGMWHRVRTELAVLGQERAGRSVILAWLEAELARAEGRYAEALSLLERAG